MKIKHCLFIVMTTIIALITFSRYVAACNEHVCAGIVSKCMLTDSCNCNLKECTCCKECFNCLSYLYSECCSCLDMCPKPNSTDNLLSKKSHVEELESIPELFAALTEMNGAASDADDDEWSVFTFPVDIEAALFGSKTDVDDFKYFAPHQELDSTTKEGEHIKGMVNCTVVFMMQCLSWNKCKANCQSMGAKSYRWFHDGCCECVGSTCLNYGVNESRCEDCPEARDDVDDLQLDEDELEYGEDVDDIEGNF